MASNYKFLLPLSLAVFVFQGFLISPSFAVQEEIESKLCSELTDEVNTFLSDTGLEHPAVKHVENPFWIFLHEITQDLDDRSYYRVVSVLAADLPYGCINPTEDLKALAALRGLPQDPVVLDLVDSMLRNFDLDRSLPNWGLAELPQLDFAKHSIRDSFEIFAGLPLEIQVVPFNQMLGPEYLLYMQDYDLSTVEARQGAKRIYEEISDPTFVDVETPIKLIIDDLATKYDLQRR